MENSELLKHALLIILGHYGSGKTNLALNCTRAMRLQGRQPTLIDLDVVNPYFRSTEFQDFAEEEGVTIIGPVFGNTALDAPSLSPAIEPAIRHASFECPVIVDVGGDPDGARALVRYAPTIEAHEDVLLVVVVNTRRPETRTAEDNKNLIDSLVGQSGLTLDGIVGNTHLAEFTTPDVIEGSLSVLEELSELSKLPVLAVTVPKELQQEGTLLQGDKLQSLNTELLLPVERIVKTVWQ